MCTKVLAHDLDNCLLNFDSKIVVTNLLDEYGGLLEDIAEIVTNFLSSEEARGKKFEKNFILHGTRKDSENEIVTIVPEEKLEQKKRELENAYSVLYSAETIGGSKSPPMQFEPLKNARVKLNSLEVRDVPKFVIKGKPPAVKKAPAAQQPKKEESAPTPVVKSPEPTPSKKSQAESKTGTLGAMFKKQEAATKALKSPEASVPKKSESAPKAGTIGAMFKKQEAAAEVKKTSPETSEKTKPSVLKPPTPRKMDEFVKKGDEAKKIKQEPAANVSVNLFEDGISSSDDEEALDALKREVLTDGEDEASAASNKRRRIIDSDDEDDAPEAKTERKDETEDAKKSTLFMDDDGFVVTVKGRKSTTAAKPVEVKKEPKKTPVKKEPAPAPAAKKQGNITNFFKKK